MYYKDEVHAGLVHDIVHERALVLNRFVLLACWSQLAYWRI
jgi:hypothetical protein